MKRFFVVAVSALLLFGLLPSVYALELLQVDQIIYQTDSGNPDLLDDLSAEVYFGDWAGGCFTMRVINTTETDLDALDNFAASVLLTGVGFTASQSLAIDSGTVAGSFVNFPSSSDMADYWGYDNQPLESGFFKNGATVDPSVTNVIATLAASTEATLSGIADPTANALIDGPPHGIMPVGYAGDPYYNQPYIDGIADFRVCMSGLTEGEFEDLVNSLKEGGEGSLVVSFGSPNAVPEPATMLLLGTGLVGLVGFRRKLKK
jgi:hypothetical protein